MSIELAAQESQTRRNLYIARVRCSSRVAICHNTSQNEEAFGPTALTRRAHIHRASPLEHFTIVRRLRALSNLSLTLQYLRRGVCSVAGA